MSYFVFNLLLFIYLYMYVSYLGFGRERDNLSAIVYL